MLADYFSVKYCRKLNISVRLLSNGLKKRLTGYAWPGNISELETDIGKTVTAGSETKLREKIVARQESGITQNNFSDLNKLCSAGEILKCIHRTGNLTLKLICGEFVSRVEEKSCIKPLNTQMEIASKTQQSCTSAINPC